MGFYEEEEATLSLVVSLLLIWARSLSSACHTIMKCLLSLQGVEKSNGLLLMSVAISTQTVILQDLVSGPSV